MKKFMYAQVLFCMSPTANSSGRLPLLTCSLFGIAVTVCFGTSIVFCHHSPAPALSLMRFLPVGRMVKSFAENEVDPQVRFAAVRVP